MEIRSLGPISPEVMFLAARGYSPIPASHEVGFSCLPVGIKVERVSRAISGEVLRVQVVRGQYQAKHCRRE